MICQVGDWAPVDPSSTLLSTSVEAVVIGSGFAVAGTLLTSWTEMSAGSIVGSNTVRVDFKI